MANFTESEIEVFSLDELKEIGFSYFPGPSMAPDDRATKPLMYDIYSPFNIPEKRSSYEQVVLKHTLEKAINGLNSEISISARQEAL
ncbi:MAG: hypothetical protein PHE15_06590, partial [Dehalococcoidales bacterium]|nr:hypothetical protein [Dehalococcoidales bacterium]